MQQNSNNNGYCVVPNSVLRNNELSIEARFLWVFCSSLPKDWRFNIKGLAIAANTTEHSVRKALAELEQKGLLQRSRERIKGKLGEVKYTLSPCVESPHVVLPHVESPRVVDLAQINTDKQIIETLNTEQQNIFSPCVESPHVAESHMVKIKYAENVAMAETEYQALVERLGTEQAVNACIEILDNYKGASGRKYKSDYRAILSWVIGEYEKRQSKKPRFNDVAGAAATVARMLEVIN